MAELSEKHGISLIKQLACCNQTMRGRALRHLLKIWLPSQTKLEEDDMKKLWKGIFYCVWHADKAPFQSELINRLSSLLVNADVQLSVQYFSVFLLTMRREWNGIDALRLDKFYLLIRRFIHNFFFLMKKNSWNLELVKSLMALLEQNTFFSKDKFHGNGVNYHIASVFLEELKPFLPVRLEVLEVLLKPFFDVLGKLADRVLVGKIKSNMFDVLLKMGKRLLQAKKSGEDFDSVDAVLYGTIPLVVGFSKKLFDLGASIDCCQSNRKVLLALSQEFFKLEKDLESSGLEISLPEACDQLENEVAALVPVENAKEVDAAIAGNELENGKAGGNDLNGNEDNSLKKCKKKKASAGSGKKQKKRSKNMDSDSKHFINSDDTDAVCQNGENLKEMQSEEEISVSLDEFVISNLQKQFEKVAEEAGLENEIGSACNGSHSMLNGATRKKRKRTKSRNVLQSQISEADIETTEVNTDGAGKISKKVKFSLKNNLVWKPQTPLPPQSLRLPPSVTPRGSALKKGVPPGPIRVVKSFSKKKKPKKVKMTI